MNCFIETPKRSNELQLLRPVRMTAILMLKIFKGREGAGEEVLQIQ